jgi:hypothetical protein
MMVEVLVASAIFLVVATAVVDVLSSSTHSTALTKQKTLAEQGVSNQVEKIRSMDYSAVGTTSGNPSGSIQPSVTFTGLNGESLGVPATLTTKITYQSANVPGSAGTNADQKKVVVKVVRTSDSTVLAEATTVLAPTQRPSQTSATIQATVVDYGSSKVVPNVQVNLSTGPSAPRSDTTDSAGTVSFSGLTPNPTSGSQAYYDLSVVPPTGYVALSDTTSPNAAAHVQLSPTQWWSTSLDVYQPVTITVQLQNADLTPYTGTATVQVTSSRGTGTFAYTGSPLTITTLSPPSGELLVPNLSYALQVTASGYQTVNDSGTVPANGALDYPTVLSRTFTETMNAVVIPPATLDVNVKAKKSSGSGNVNCPNASVTVTGGPDSVNVTQTADSSGVASFSLTPGSGYAIFAQSTLYPALTKTKTNQTVSSPTTSNNMNVGTSVGNQC